MDADENETNDKYVETSDFDVVTYGFKYLALLMENKRLTIDELTPSMFGQSSFVRRTDFRTGIVRMFKLLGMPLLSQWHPLQNVVKFVHIYQDVAVLTDAKLAFQYDYSIYHDYVVALMKTAAEAEEERKEQMRRGLMGEKKAKALFVARAQRVQSRFVRRFMQIHYIEKLSGIRASSAEYVVSRIGSLRRALLLTTLYVFSVQMFCARVSLGNFDSDETVQHSHADVANMDTIASVAECVPPGGGPSLREAIQQHLDGSRNASLRLSTDGDSAENHGDGADAAPKDDIVSREGGSPVPLNDDTASRVNTVSNDTTTGPVTRSRTVVPQQASSAEKEERTITDDGDSKVHVLYPYL